MLAPVGLLALVLSPVVGKNIAKVDPRRFATFAFLVFALVLWMRSNFSTQADIANAWRRIRSQVTSWRDLDPALMTEVEKLIDFVTADHADTLEP